MKGTTMSKYEHLRSLIEPLVRKIGGDVEKEFDELLQRARTFDAMQPLVQAAKDALRAVERVPGKELPASPESPIEVPARRRQKRRRRRRGEAAKDKAEQDRQRVDIQLALLRAEAQGSKALGRARENCKKLGFSDRQIGSMHAWTHGKFIPRFVTRVYRTYGDEGLKILSTVYTKLKTLPRSSSVQALKKLAGIRAGKRGTRK